MVITERRVWLCLLCKDPWVSVSRHEREVCFVPFLHSSFVHDVSLCMLDWQAFRPPIMMMMMMALAREQNKRERLKNGAILSHATTEKGGNKRTGDLAQGKFKTEHVRCAMLGRPSTAYTRLQELIYGSDQSRGAHARLPLASHHPPPRSNSGSSLRVLPLPRNGAAASAAAA